MTTPQHLPIRALVTRPRAEAAELATALAARRIEAVIEPLIEIRYCTAPALDLARTQAVLCTSANGVRALARACQKRTVPLFAVGDATAARARYEGFRSVESAGGDVDDLARLVRARLRADAGPLLHVAGSTVAGDLAGMLRANGFAIERAVLYEAVAAERLSDATEALLASGSIDLALFFSPRTATIFARLAGVGGVADALARVRAISISPVADAALSGLRFRERAIAARPTQSALLERIDSLLLSTASPA